jgi:hypothetical protein
MSPKLSLLSPLIGGNGRSDAVEQLAGEVKAVRENLTWLVSELDRRVWETLDPVLRHRQALTVAGLAGLALIVGGAVALLVPRHRPEPSPMEKARRLRQAVARIIEDPDSLAPPAPRVGRDILGAAGTVVAAAVAKKMLDRALARV